MGCKIGLVLTPKEVSNLGSKPSQCLAIGIHQQPFLVDRLAVGGFGFVAQCIHYYFFKLNTSSPINGLQMYNY
jgi:hypothetical protein